MKNQKKYILSKETADKKMRRMAFEIVEDNPDEKKVILAGISESGTIVAKCIQKMLTEISDMDAELISISLNKRKPADVNLSKEIDFNDKVIIVVDDVANSGKTLLYALKPFLAYHPKKIQTMVLVERSHNSFPVRPDYFGMSVSTTLQEHIYVEVDKEKVLGAYVD